MELNPVFRFVVDLDLRMVWSQMAFAAIFRLPDERHAEAMPDVASDACAFAGVRINAADVAIGPCVGIEFAVA